MPKKELSEQSFIIRNLAMILVLIGMAVGAVTWAATEHAKIKDWTIDQDNIKESKIEEDTFNRYTQQRDSARSEEKIDRLKESVDGLRDNIEEVRLILLGSTIKPVRFKPDKTKK